VNFAPPGRSAPAGRPGAGHAAEPAEGELPDVLRFVRARLASGDHSVHAELVAAVERVLLREVLERAGGYISDAARLIGVSRPPLRAKLAALLPEVARGSGGDGD
jgi:DNA-binding NtrC family response regulator